MHQKENILLGIEEQTGNRWITNEEKKSW